VGENDMKSVKELAEKMGISVQAVREKIREGKIAAEKCGSYWIISDLEASRALEVRGVVTENKVS